MTELDTGFSVRRIVMPAGVYESPGAGAHFVSLHVGAPVRASCLREGKLRPMLQVAGDAEIIPAGEPGRWEDETPAEIISMRISPRFLDAIAEERGLDPRRVSLVSRTKVRDAQIGRIGLALEKALAEPTKDNSLLIDSLGLELGERLLQRHASVHARRPANKLSRRQLHAVLDYVEENLGHRLRLEELARVAGLGASNFKALFRNTEGVSVHQYVISRRVERAASLIQQGALPLSQIALEAGFAHQSHLSRMMRKAMGVTPGSLSRRA